jgi:hypothetical protein
MTVGKPYEGKPHVRFDVAGDGNLSVRLKRVVMPENESPMHCTIFKKKGNSESHLEFSVLPVIGLSIQMLDGDYQNGVI